MRIHTTSTSSYSEKDDCHCKKAPEANSGFNCNIITIEKPNNNNTTSPCNKPKSNSIDDETEKRNKVLEKSAVIGKVVAKKLPIINWIQDYNTNKLITDIIAGFTVGLTILPQALAYATLGGVPAQYGLYSSFIGCFIYIFFGSTKAVTIGPTAGLTIITLIYSKGKPPMYSVLLCLLNGLVTLAMGVFNLGFLVNFISKPVMSGFTSAVAITIVSTQIKALLGLSFPANGIIDVVQGTIAHITELKFMDTVLSVICIITLLILQNIQFLNKYTDSAIVHKSLWFISTARNAIVVVLCTAIFTAIGDGSVVDVIGHIQSGLPSLAAPSMHFSSCDAEASAGHGNISLLSNNTEIPGGNVAVPGAGQGLEGCIEYSMVQILQDSASALIVLPILSIMEHVTIAKALASSSEPLDTSQEMITIGLSNIFGSFFGSIPITGSFSRTLVNHSSGVASPLGGLVTGILVLASLQFLTPAFYYIPNSTLAAIIVLAVIFTIDVGILVPMWNSKRMDFLPWGTTLLVSLTIGLPYGIASGLLISLGFLLYYNARPKVRVSNAKTCSGTKFILVELDRSLVFPSMEYTMAVISKAGSKWGHDILPVVLNCSHIQFADYSAASGIKDICSNFNAKKQPFVLWKLKPSVVRIVTGVLESAGTPFYHCSTEQQLESFIEETKMKLTNEDKNLKNIMDSVTFTISEIDDSDEEEADC